MRTGWRSIAATLLLALGGCVDDGPADTTPGPDAPAPDGAVDMARPDAAPDASPPDMTPQDAAPPDMLPDAEPPSRYAAIDRCLMTMLETSQATGAAVAIVEHGELVHAAGLGHRNDPGQTPVEASSLFRFGSVLKGMTALAVFTEIERGSVAFETPIAQVLPPLAEHRDPRWQAVTLHHLLNHQGGFFDLRARQPAGQPDRVLGQVVESGEFAQGAYFMVDPGTFYNYSNPNYMLAGRVLEVLTGETYRAAMQRLVFAPLGMRRMLFRPADVLVDGDYVWGTTAGEQPGELEALPADAYDSVWGRPAGMGWASVIDLARYAQYVMHGDRLGGELDPEPWQPPVSPETWQVWRSPQVEAGSLFVHTEYGNGLVHYAGLLLQSGYHPLPVVAHNGNVLGYSSALVTVPGLDLGVAVLTNGNGLNGPLEACVAPLLGSSDGLPPAEVPPDRSPTPETFDSYVGTYDGGQYVGPMIVERTEGGGLGLSLPRLDAAGMPYDAALQPVARDVFVVRVQGVQSLLTGIRPAPGEPVQYLRTRYFVGIRAEEAAQKRAVDVEPLRRRLEDARRLGETIPARVHR